MPIDAQNPVSSGFPAAYDKLLLRSFVLTGRRLAVQLSRYGEVGAQAVEQPRGTVNVIVEDVLLADSATSDLVNGVRALVSAYNVSGGKPDLPARSLRISGAASRESGITASMRLVRGIGDVLDIPDCYAVAAGDGNFASLLSQFLGLIAAYNAAKKVV